MSFRTLLSHRCDVSRLFETGVDGAPVYEWLTVQTGVRCYLDLTFLRRGKDPMWTPETGRPTDRTGVFFCEPKAAIIPGDRVKVRYGREVLGIFSIEGTKDLVVGHRGRPHHIEVGCTEVALPLGRA